MKRWLSGVVALVCFLCLAVPVPAHAEENMVPNYEVKLLIDSGKVLNKEHQLNSEYRDFLHTGKNYATIGVLYIETSDYDFAGQGWNNRLRIKQDKSKFELTYKKRYPIVNGDIDGALTLANEEGFDITDTNYEAQVDWGYDKMTLSLSNHKTASNKGYDDMELPKKGEAIDLLKQHMPGKLEDWMGNNWGKDTIKKGEKCGPVYYYKYAGKLSGIDIDIEVWPVHSKSTGRTEYITEISLKEDTFDAAASSRKELMDILEEEGILLHEDSLKTQKILDAYLK